VLEQTLPEIWQSALYARFRELHATGRWRDMSLCARCMDWQHMQWDHGFEKAVRKVLGGGADAPASAAE
jgi:hypothetical protein